MKRPGSRSSLQSSPASRDRGRGGRPSRRNHDAPASPAMAAAAAPHAAAAGADAIAAVEQPGRHVVTHREALTELATDDSAIGPGAHATVLFHEEHFDTAMISLAPGGSEIVETNSTDLNMLYFVVEMEDGQVEFELHGRIEKQRLSRMGEVQIPAGASYTLRNLSRQTEARLMAIVPR
eukprot:TRINITY_DN110609_c0_g1_i1.p1 TRINITY_DN110609_c0_g1~~TRINITY_DN110609_c0_g1_i1.p1  ORF type:complete len:206 (-),score=37.17 TRINITY_DN110609_c0_g1_i1:157-693(-)